MKRNFLRSGFYRAVFMNMCFQDVNGLSTMNNAPQAMRKAPAGGGAPVVTMINGGANQPGMAGDSTAALASAINNLANSQRGVIDFGDDSHIISAPRSVTWTVTSTFQTSAIIKNVTAFNQSTDAGIGATTTSNGGATAISYNYNDLPAGSTTGNLISRIASEYRSGHGIWCYGFNIQYLINGVQNSTAVSNANPTMNYYQGDSTIVPLYFNIQDALRNTQYLSGIFTIKKGFNIPGSCQMQITIPAGDGATANVACQVLMTFLFRPIAS